jgi:hypothetical protein
MMSPIANALAKVKTFQLITGGNSIQVPTSGLRKQVRIKVLSVFGSNFSLHKKLQVRLDIVAW